ncbi:alpha/beta-hydrolase [Ramaria rubella]|nr:alpha/beta-hydrolase [Ramaria rubella]
MIRLHNAIKFGVIISTFSAPSSWATPPGPVIDLGYVSLVGNATAPSGVLNGPVHFFGAVPYAQPPLGSLRFRAPQPLDEEPSAYPPVIDSRDWGPACIQQPTIVGVGSEDCLLLNVWKPNSAMQGDKLSVVVYVYPSYPYLSAGRWFCCRTPQSVPMYDWVNQSRAVIAVSLGYRLNFFGFLTSPSMAPTDLNAGLLDQRAALDWIQRNIAKFGGDPEAVTIVGESAGGASTVMQVVAYGGTQRPPFARAVSQSPGYGPVPTTSQSAQAFLNATKVVGCPPAGDDALDCLRNASLGALIAASNQVPPGMFSPIVSGPGTILPELPAALIRAGNFSVVDFIGGHCSNDGRTFTDGTPTTLLTEQQLIAAVLNRWPGLTNSTIKKMLELYPAPGVTGSPFDTEYDRTWVIEQDAVFGCMDWFLANRTAERGGENTFHFRFNAPNPVAYAANPYLGVMHGSDVFFLFDGTNGAANTGYTFSGFNITEMPLSQEIISYWTSFKRAGDPSKFKQSYSPVWEKQSTGKRVVMTRSTTPGNGTASTLEDMTAYEVEVSFLDGRGCNEPNKAVGDHSICEKCRFRLTRR